MAYLQILPITDPLLKEKSLKVLMEDGVLPDYIVPLANDMLETSRAVGGAGLAAVQVGHLIQMFIMDLALVGGPTEGFINPEIIESAEYTVARKEGCLSMPDIFFEVERPAWIRVRYIDLDGVVKEERFEGFEALCVLHEMDHLNGVRAIDLVSPLRRQKLLNLHKKNVREKQRSKKAA